MGSYGSGPVPWSRGSYQKSGLRCHPEERWGAPFSAAAGPSSTQPFRAVEAALCAQGTVVSGVTA